MYLEGQILYDKVKKEFVQYGGFYELGSDNFGKKKGDFTVLMVSEKNEIFAPDTPRYWEDVTNLIVKDSTSLPVFCREYPSKFHDPILDVDDNFKFSEEKIKILRELLESEKIYLGENHRSKK